MFKWLNKFFKSDAELRRKVEEINALEPETQKLTDQQLMAESLGLRHKVEGLRSKEALDEVLPRAFALVREAAKRALGQRHFDVQLMGGIVLHQGKIAEMRTGEGKTLTATLAAYLNALAGKGVHLVTVNEYLAKRDAVWMGQIYHALGLKVACLIHEGAKMYDPHFRIPADGAALIDKERDTTGSFLVQENYLRPVSRKEAYAADITYGTNHEFGFDHLRDNLAYDLNHQVQRGHHYAIIDEVDSILIDEARTPLIISAPDAASSEFYKTFARVVRGLKEGEDYTKDEKLRAVQITDEGIGKVEKAVGVKNIYDPENLRLTHYLQESLKAEALFHKDKDYVVKDGEIVLVDQFTGRMLLGRRYSGGLHQAIEAKEGLRVQQESKTYASISIQNYFRMYQKIAGMTGTAQTSAEEFDKVYKLEVATIQPNRPMIRNDQPDLIYKTLAGKFAAVVEEIRRRREKGQPVLVGTVSIEKNEMLSQLLKRAGIPHEVLNAKNNEREGAIIAQAGKPGAVTVATNVAGRGVDIILGGNPPEILEAQKVKDIGGLHVIGTERHESRRIDNQLRGRAGRQGDPGSSQFFLSVEDDLMRIFGGDRLKNMMNFLKVPEEMPIESRVVTRAVGQAQAKVEGFNFDGRKHLLDYDDVLNKQRKAIYQKRQALLANGVIAPRHPERSEGSRDFSPPKADQNDGAFVDESTGETKGIALAPMARNQALGMLDMLWMTHLENMEALGESVRLRAYGQKDPLIEYRREGHLLFQQLLSDFDQWVEENKGKLEEMSKSKVQMTNQAQNPNDKTFDSLKFDIGHSGQKPGRNDLCPCGSGKKYKKCHGK